MTKPWPESRDGLRLAYQSAVAVHGKLHAVAALAKEFDVPDRATRRRLESARIVVAKPRRPDGPELQRLYESVHDPDLPKKTIGKVAESLEISGHTAWRWLSEAGVITVKQEKQPRMSRKIVIGDCPCGQPAVTRFRGEDPALCMSCYHKRRNKDRNHNPRNGRLEVLAFKIDKPCTDCGVSYPPYVMDLDHVPERGPKLFNLGSPERNLKEVRAELVKCDLVCANCHRVRTWKRRQANLPSSEAS